MSPTIPGGPGSSTPTASPRSGRWCWVGCGCARRDGLPGHSDADVLAHAIMDALLGAAGLEDIGHYFPDTDPAFAGADSMGCWAGWRSLVRGSRLASRSTWTRWWSAKSRGSPRTGEAMRERLAAAMGVEVGPGGPARHHH